MKYITIYTLVALLALLNFSCEDFTSTEALGLKTPVKGSPEYYEALREYKKTDHAICFGWWLRSNEPFTANMANRYMGLPDSMDIVSVVRGIPEPGSETWNEMQLVRELKGTRFVLFITDQRVEDLMRLNFPEVSDSDLMSAIDSVAVSLVDTINKYQIDGLDFDYEPGYGSNSIFGQNGGTGATNDKYTQRLFKALSKDLGPASGTGQLLIIDGQFDIGIEPYIDYLAQQAYNTSSFSSLQSRFRSFGGGVLPSKKFVVTENMQTLGGFGARFMYKGENIGSVTAMAMWNPVEGRKGGFGGFVFDNDWDDAPADAQVKGELVEYYYLRKGIQIQNPAP
ncbi:MAG: glycoside hydrolase family 18 [Bacteroidales bacterium]